MPTRRKSGGGGWLFKRRSRLTGKELPTWWLGYYVRGERRKRRESSGTTSYAEARDLLRKRLGETAGPRRRRPDAERRTVGELLALVEKAHADSGRTTPAGHIAALTAALGHLKVGEVDRELLDDLVRDWKAIGVTWPGRKASRVRPVGGGTATHYMNTLSHGYTLAKEKWQLVTGLTFPSETGKARGKYLPPETFRAILAEIADEDVRAVCELAYLTGKRKGQWRNLEVGNVVITGSGANARWAIHWRPDQTKNGQADILPLTGRSLAIVQAAHARRREGCPFLFHSTRYCGHWTRRHQPGDPCLGRFNSEWQTACKQAGVPCGWKQGGYVFHNTRHSAVTNMTAAGIPDSVATTISGHHSLAVFKRYGIRRESVQRAAQEQVEQYLRGLTEPEKARSRA